MNFTPFPTIKTERLALRKLKERDAYLVYNYQSNKDNFRHVDMPVYMLIDEAQNYIHKMNSGVEDNLWIIWAISDKDTDEILGTISIWNINTSQKKAELGYGLYPGNRGKGIMTEAMKAVMVYGFEEMGLESLEAYTNVSNSKSIGLLERLGFKRKSLFIDKETYSGKPQEMVVYELQKDIII